MGANPGGIYSAQYSGSIPPQYFSWKWKIPHTMYSTPTLPRHMSANYAESVAQISSVGNNFLNTAIITNLHPPSIKKLSILLNHFPQSSTQICTLGCGSTDEMTTTIFNELTPL